MKYSNIIVFFQKRSGLGGKSAKLVKVQLGSLRQLQQSWSKYHLYRIGESSAIIVAIEKNLPNTGTEARSVVKW